MEGNREKNAGDGDLSWLFSRRKFENLDQYLAKREYDKALHTVAAELKRNPNQFNLLLRQAAILALAGDRDAAVRVSRELTEHYAKDGFYAKAIALYKKIPKLDPEFDEEKVKELQASELFAAFTGKALHEVLTSTSLRSYYEGDVIRRLRGEE